MQFDNNDKEKNRYSIPIVTNDEFMPCSSFSMDGFFHWTLIYTDIYKTVEGGKKFDDIFDVFDESQETPLHLFSLTNQFPPTSAPNFHSPIHTPTSSFPASFFFTHTYPTTIPLIFLLPLTL
jgi:hypothetical protein